MLDGVKWPLHECEVGMHDTLSSDSSEVWEELVTVRAGVRVCGYHDALPRQILVHEDMVSWETPKKAEIRHLIHVALEPWGQPLKDHPTGMGEPTPVL